MNLIAASASTILLLTICGTLYKFLLKFMFLPRPIVFLHFTSERLLMFELGDVLLFLLFWVLF